MFLLAGVARLRARPWLLVAGAAVVACEAVASFAGLAAAGLVVTSSPETPLQYLAVGLFTVGPALVVRPVPLAVLYAACRTEPFGRRDVLPAVGSGYPRLLAGSAAGHAAALLLLPAALVVAAPVVLVGVQVAATATGDPAVLSARPLPDSTLRILGMGTVAVGYVLAYLPVAFADLRLLDQDGRPTRREVARAPLDALGGLLAAPRRGARYLLARSAVTVVAAGVGVAAFAVGVESGRLPGPAVGWMAAALLLGWVVAACRALVAVLHVETYASSVRPAVAGAASARPRRWLAGVVLAGLLVTAPVVAAGATAYGSEVSTAYAPDSPPTPAADAYVYEGRIAFQHPNGTERELVAIREATAGERTVVWTDDRRGGYHIQRRAVADGPLVYRVVSADSSDVYRTLRRDDDPDEWRHGDDDTRTVYVQEWGDISTGLFDPADVAERFAYRRVGTTTYRGRPAVAYAAKSWLLPRDSHHLPARGRLLVARETRAMLRLNVTVPQDDGAVRFDYAFRRSDERATRRAAERVVAAVRRNVTVDSPLYPDRFLAEPGVAAYRSGRVVGAAFHLDDVGATVPAGARVTAVGANGTNYTTTLGAAVTPTADDRPLAFDIAFELRADGTLVRRRPDALAAMPEREGPNVTRFVVRAPSGPTYVAANVTNAPLRTVAVDAREDAGDLTYAAVRPEPAGEGLLRLEVTDARTGETVYDDPVRVAGTGYLTWLDDDTMLLLQRRPSDGLVDDAAGNERREYVVRAYGPRGLVAERRVTLARPLEPTPTPTAGA
ncbi:hypothetical protein [Halorarius halobius]|uniref:hypothetical protein n=1 Tax=Halorarius halobius TaxID=2962671 RepID=UPI0020CE6DDD|nr:hypothetical protein [Halorarius halobius]